MYVQTAGCVTQHAPGVAAATAATVAAAAAGGWLVLVLDMKRMERT